MKDSPDFTTIKLGHTSDTTREYPTKPILYVRWIDAMNHQDRLFISVMKAKELTTAETIGYLIHEDDEKIILAQNIYHIPETPEPSAENCMEIPKGTIKERREL